MRSWSASESLRVKTVEATLKMQLPTSVRLMVTAAAVCAAMICFVGPIQNAAASGETRSLKMFHLHTQESIEITYKRNGQYDPEALKKLDWFLRDWRQEKSTRMDPRLFDTIWQAYRDVGATQPIQVVCGYRAPETNAMLRRRSRGVAKFSQHMLGKAMDFYIPGVDLSTLRIAGLKMQRGGVGFYPSSGSPFVHMDAGSVRMWPRMTREQLANVFPDGKTVHMPSDGRPMPRYQEAYAALKRNGMGGFVGGQEGDSSDTDDNAIPSPVLASLSATDSATQPGQAAPTLTRSFAPLPSPRPAELLQPSLAQPQLAWQTGPAPVSGAAVPLVRPGAAVLASADPSAPTLTRRLTTVGPATKPVVAYAPLNAPLRAAGRDKPALISTRFEQLNFASLATSVPAARDKSQAKLVKPDLNSVAQMIRSPARMVMMHFGASANQDMRVAQFTGAAIKPLRVANLAGTDPAFTGALATR